MITRLVEAHERRVAVRHARVVRSQTDRVDLDGHVEGVRRRVVVREDGGARLPVAVLFGDEVEEALVRDVHFGPEHETVGDGVVDVVLGRVAGRGVRGVVDLGRAAGRDEIGRVRGGHREQVDGTEDVHEPGKGQIAAGTVGPADLIKGLAGAVGNKLIHELLRELVLDLSGNGRRVVGDVAKRREPVFGDLREPALVVDRREPRVRRRHGETELDEVRVAVRQKDVAVV
mmetsp:Transcript_27571/g.84579  ORF Transcript_27571/g.84579 Transcript_27571/m.84579 type:complete len:230 (+) Transcript_27571:2319-3008(+)